MIPGGSPQASRRKGLFMKWLLVLMAVRAVALAQDQAPWTDAVREAVSTVQEQAASAYEALLLEVPGAAGRITLGFTVNRDGFVSAVEVEYEEVLAPVALVIEAAAGDLMMGPLDIFSPVDISIPFDFSPPEE